MSDNVVTSEDIRKMLSLSYKKEPLYLIINNRAYNVYNSADMAALEKYRQEMVLTLYKEGKSGQDRQLNKEADNRD